MARHAIVDRPGLAGTFLADLPEPVAAELLASSRTIDVPAGRFVFTAAETRVFAALLVAGTVRAFVSAADGRQLTVRDARAGSLLGALSEVPADHAPLSIQAVTDSRLIEFDGRVFWRLVESDRSLAIAVVRELNARLESVYTRFADSVFGSMRQRVVRQLLALAAPGGSNGHLMVPVTQQQLADCIGTSREVVARVLAILRREGLIRTAAREIEILDVPRATSLLGEWRTRRRVLETDLPSSPIAAAAYLSRSATSAAPASTACAAASRATGTRKGEHET
jgi:CRP/FNR family cyclic AMP-dependent transcriptional regulator